MKCSIRISLLVLLVALSSFGLVNAKDCDVKMDPCGKATEWNEFETVRLRMKQEGMPEAASWYMQSSRKNNDLQLDVDVPDPHSPQKGTIMMVEGAVLVSKGIELLPGREIDALDEPVLSVILTGKVLSRALPGGPKCSFRKETSQP